MNFTEIKTMTRRAVHSAFAVPCSYSPPPLPGTGYDKDYGDAYGSNSATFGYGNAYGQSYGGTIPPVELTARLQDKLQIGGGAADQQGYSTIIEQVTAVVFNREELATVSVVPARGGRVSFHDYNGTGESVTLELDNKFPLDGPIDEKWSIVPI